MKKQTPMSITDKEIVYLLDSDDFNEKQKGAKAIYRNHFAIVENYLVSNGADKGDVKDIFQEGLAILYIQIKSKRYKDQAKLSTYLIGICKRLWYKQLVKTKKRVHTHELDQEEDNLIVIQNEIEQDNKVNAVLSMLKQLSEDCQKVLKLFYYQKKSMKDISHELGYKGVQSAKNKKNKCLKYLKSKIRADHTTWKLFEIA